MAGQSIIIRNEADAFNALERALNNELSDQPLKIKFIKWPIVTIQLEGPGYESTITSDMAEGLVDLQKAINRAFARIAHDVPNARKLRLEEKNELKFKAKVENKCSLFTIDLGQVTQKAVEMVGGKMTPESLAITFIGLAIVGGGTIAYKAFLKHRAEVAREQIEKTALVDLSREETKRMELMAKAMQREPVLREANADYDIARHSLVKGVSDAESISINGIEMDNRTANIIASTPRSSSRDIQANGNYYIRETKWLAEDTQMLVEDAESGRKFRARLNISNFSPDQVEALKEAEYSQSKVFMSINANELRGEITAAAIISVKPQPTKK